MWNTLSITNANIERQSEDVRDNRDRLMELCTENKSVVMNTMSQKQEMLKATYMEKKNHAGGPPYVSPCTLR